MVCLTCAGHTTKFALKRVWPTIAVTSKVKGQGHKLTVCSSHLCLFLIRETKCCTCVIRGGRGGIPCRPNPAATLHVAAGFVYLEVYVIYLEPSVQGIWHIPWTYWPRNNVKSCAFRETCKPNLNCLCLLFSSYRSPKGTDMNGQSAIDVGLRLSSGHNIFTDISKWKCQDRN